jgi:hypothetical protein
MTFAVISVIGILKKDVLKKHLNNNQQSTTMQFQGRIFRLYPIQSGTSANGNQWSRQDFVFEYFENQTDRYADRVLLSVMNERIKEYDLHEGDECIIGFAHTTREYQGRCFNDIRIYHFEKVKQVETQPAMSTAPASATPTQTVVQQPAQAEDLPF